MRVISTAIAFAALILTGCNETKEPAQERKAYSAEDIRGMVRQSITFNGGILTVRTNMETVYAMSWPVSFLVKCDPYSLTVSFGRQDHEGNHEVTVYVASGRINLSECPAHAEFIGRHLLSLGSRDLTPAASAPRQ